MKVAVCQVADSGPLESLAVWLRCAGYEPYMPSASLCDELRRVGCDCVYDHDRLVRSGSYDRVEMPTKGTMDDVDLYIDVKAHRAYTAVVDRWPWLVDRVLWYRINGGAPERVPGMGDEVAPPCPVLTPNLWYRGRDDAYAAWPPFVRFGSYGPRVVEKYTQPLCLVHNLVGWGFGALIPSMRRLGVAMHGDGSPDGLLSHDRVADAMRRALAYIHLKSSDAPGYALYEALASGCPCVVSRRLAWRCHMGELFVPGETCLAFDEETHGPLDVDTCMEAVAAHLDYLKDPRCNRTIGEAGRRRLIELMWREDRDGASLVDFFRRNFP